MADDLTRSLELVRRAQAGDEDALNRLFSRYYERVRRVVRLRLGKRLREVVDSGDILQETFAAAVRAFDGFEVREEASLIQWLAKLAERQIIAAADFHLAQKRDQRRNVPLAPPVPGSPTQSFAITFADDTTRPLERLVAGEEAALVDDCLDRLQEDYRELIVLRNFVGASWEEVAEATGRPSPAAARMMHARALVELGKLARAAGLSG
jgi:RNA polymerase sigma-70 factor (ECF subfamily)